MKTMNTTALRSAFTTNPKQLYRRTSFVCVLAWMAFLLPAVLTTSRAAYTLAPQSDTRLDTQPNAAYIVGHIYLNAPDGTATDVTNAYVQTGSVYDAQKGYFVQTGYVMMAGNSSLDVTVNMHDGGIEDWGGYRRGFVWLPTNSAVTEAVQVQATRAD